MSLLATSCSQESPDLTIGSGGSLGNYYAAARSIARVVNQQQATNGFRLAYAETAGSVGNVESVLSGEIPFGIAQADVEYQAVNGVAGWKERGPQADLRALFTLYTEAITVVATPASKIRTTRDLIGKRIDIGHPDSGARRNAVDTLDALGVDWRTDSTVHGATPSERSSMYLRGELDAFFHTVGHPTTDIEFAVNSTAGARLISLDNVPQLLEGHPYYSRTVIRIDLYQGVHNAVDVETVGVKTVFVTSSKVSEDVVYNVTRAVFEGIDKLGEYDPVMKGLTRQSMLEGATAPLHPGALKYYQEAGLKPGS
jgi:TRAP transporter TAXI family solute receptor